MKTYNQTIEGITYRYYYDHIIKLWTVYPIDNEGSQNGNAEYFQNKSHLLINYKFNFKTIEGDQYKTTIDLESNIPNISLSDYLFK